MRHIDTLIVHCADTYSHMDIGVEDIRNWHVEGNGWKDIGYHFVIRRDGTIEEGRPIADIGAHVLGHNVSSIGICLVGGKGPDGKALFNFTSKQMFFLGNLIADLRFAHPIKTLAGHRDFTDGKECPCFDVKEYIDG